MNRISRTSAALAAAVLLPALAVTAAHATDEGEPSPSPSAPTMVEVGPFVYPLLDPSLPPSWSNSGVQVLMPALPSCTDVPSGAQYDRVVEGTPVPDVIVPPTRAFPPGTVGRHVSIPVCEEPEPEPEQPVEPQPPVDEEEPVTEVVEEEPPAAPAVPLVDPWANPRPGSVEESTVEYARIHGIHPSQVQGELG